MKAQYKTDLSAAPRRMFGFGMDVNRKSADQRIERKQTPMQIFNKVKKSLEKQYRKENVRQSVERHLTVLTVR